MKIDPKTLAPVGRGIFAENFSAAVLDVKVHGFLRIRSFEMQVVYSETHGKLLSVTANLPPVVLPDGATMQQLQALPET
jgi:hypothetical protein